MTRTLKVKPWSLHNSEQRYDVFIAAVGYETRSRYIAETLGITANNKVACAFPDRQVFNYEENLDWYYRAGYKVNEVTDQDFSSWCRTTLEPMKSRMLENRSICIDISSMNRYRIAELFNVIRALEWSGDIQVDFLYAIANYSSPPKESAPNRHVGPVLPSFAGWTVQPDGPPVAIVGLGYEEEKALGAVEHIQAAGVWAFIPESPITAYADAVKHANRDLLDYVPLSRQLFYPVHQPFNSFVKLESLTHRILRSNSPVLFPFGPKMFTVCALSVACLYPSVAVWRVSTGAEGEAVDREAHGPVYGLRVEFSPMEEEIEQVIAKQLLEFV